MMEDFPAMSQDAVDVCRNQVEQSHLLIGIYANRYGYCPQGYSKSITEMEYDWAAAKNIDRLIFVLDKNKIWDKTHPIRVHADNNPLLTDFLERIGKDVVWKTFTTPEDLALKVNQSLESWEKSRQRAAHQSRRLDILEQPRPVIAVTFIWVLAMLAVLLSGFIQLLRSGAEPLNYVAALATVIPLTVIPLFGSFTRIFQHLVQASKLRIPYWSILLVFLGLVFAGTVWARGQLFQIIGNQRIDAAIQTTNLAERKLNLESAAGLVPDVDFRLRQKLLQGLDTLQDETDYEYLRQTAMTYASYVPDHPSDLDAELTNRIESAIKAQTSQKAIWFASILAILSPETARTVAGELNDASINALVASDSKNGFITLQVVQALDQAVGIEANATNTAASVRSYNLG
jgi:hypothetical protein